MPWERARAWAGEAGLLEEMTISERGMRSLLRIVERRGTPRPPVVPVRMIVIAGYGLVEGLWRNIAELPAVIYGVACSRYYRDE